MNKEINKKDESFTRQRAIFRKNCEENIYYLLKEEVEQENNLFDKVIIEGKAWATSSPKIGYCSLTFAFYKDGLFGFYKCYFDNKGNFLNLKETESALDKIVKNKSCEIWDILTKIF